MSAFKGKTFRTNSWAVDFDYLDKLSKEEYAYLLKFSEEHYNGNIKGAWDLERDSIHQTIGHINNCYKRNERAQHCTLNRTNPVSTINTEEGYKDIFDIYDTNPNENYKNDSHFYYQPDTLLETEVNSRIIEAANYKSRKRRRTMQEINRELLTPVSAEDVRGGYKAFHNSYLKQHPIFMSFDWNSVLEKEIA